MEVPEMRDLVAGAYFSPQWKYKVSKMRDNQIIAIYFSLEGRGMFTKEAIERRKETEKMIKVKKERAAWKKQYNALKAPVPKQLTIFDFM